MAVTSPSDSEAQRESISFINSTKSVGIHPAPSDLCIMSFQYDFPSELLLTIFREVKSYEDLLTLAATCRRFNHLSLQVFFSNHNFDPNSKTIILHPYGESLENISALAMSLALRKFSLEHLSFDFGRFDEPELLLDRIRILTRYIMNLSAVDRVTLHIVIPSVPGAGNWKAAYVALLDTVIGKSCSNLHVETHQSWEAIQQKEDLFSVWKAPSWFRIPGRHLEAVKKSNGEVKYLKDCFIETFPTFLRPFYFRVLKMNSPILTSLAFKYIFGSMAAIDLGFLITNIHLPVLKRFAISFCDTVPLDAIIKFLSKHPHITNFEYHHTTYTSKPKGVPRGLKGAFKHLERLSTTPEHILAFLPTMDRMPCLASVTIIIEVSSMDVRAVEKAFRRLFSCVNKIELTLDISSVSVGLQVLPDVLHFRSREDGFMLRCVESLHIRWGYAAQYAAIDLGQIPAWLTLFPELKKLSIPSPQWLEVERNTLPSFFEQVKLACPIIESISLLGESVWTL